MLSVTKYREDLHSEFWDHKISGRPINLTFLITTYHDLRKFKDNVKSWACMGIVHSLSPHSQDMSITNIQKNAASFHLKILLDHLAL
jgi:hypothetical protein